MKVEVQLDGKVPNITVSGLLIVPETDFEVACLEQFGSDEKRLKAFLKYGMSGSELMGLKIKGKEI